MDEQSSTCNHKWVGGGIWDGKTDEGSKTGGVVYTCSLCGEKAFTKEEIETKGGEIDEEASTIKAAPAPESQSEEKTQ